MKCQVGDLAVVVSAQFRSNLGRIVNVVAADDGACGFSFRGQGMVWKVTCHQRMTWRFKGKRYRRKTGPVPDNRLQPIRGLPPGTLVAKPAESDAGAGKKAERKRSIATIEG